MFVEVLSVGGVVALLQVGHHAGLEVGVGGLVGQYLAYVHAGVVVVVPILLRFVPALEVGELLDFIDHLEPIVKLDLRHVPCFQLLGLVHVLHEGVEDLELVEFGAYVLVTGHDGGLLVGIGVEEGVVAEQSLAGLLERRDLCLEGIEVVQDDIVAFEFEGVVLVHLLGEFYLLLLDSQVDLLE